MTQTSDRRRPTARAGSTSTWLDGISVLAHGQTPALDLAVRLVRQFGAEVRSDSPGSDAAEEPGRPQDVDVVLVDRIAEPAGPSGWPPLPHSRSRIGRLSSIGSWWARQRSP